MTRPTPDHARVDHARGALLGLAIGDALGMPTQNLPPALVLQRYGPVLGGFEPAPGDNEISRGLPAARVTDDTDQAVILGRLLVEGRGHVDPARLTDELLAWERRMRAAGSLDLLGPSTRRALELAARGVPASVTGRAGDTNGAAMRIAPVGIAVPTEPLERLVDAVEQASHVTHATGVAIGGAAAVAAAVSAGIEGRPVADALRLAVSAARIGTARGWFSPGADVASRAQWAIDLVRGQDPERARDLIVDLVGTGVSTVEAVPAALAVVALFADDPWAACRFAAALGGDSDTIAAMAGAVVGALHGASAFPSEAVERLRATNPDLRLPELADELLALRARRPARVLLAGSVIVDVRMNVGALPARGGDVLASALSTDAGGGFNVVAAVARQDVACAFAGLHGAGPYGELVREALAAERVSVLLPPSLGGDTGMCVALVEPDGERTFVTAAGVEATLSGEDLSRVEPCAGDVVYVSGYDLAYEVSGPVLAAWATGLPDGVGLVLDPGPLVLDIPAARLDEVLARLTVLTLNQREAQLLAGSSATGQPLLDDLGRALAGRLHPDALLVVREGAAGCRATGGPLGDRVVVSPAPQVDVVDTTGAGDAHTGVLMASLLEGRPVEEALLRANTAAAHAVTRQGPATSPTRVELDRLLTRPHS